MSMRCARYVSVATWLPRPRLCVGRRTSRPSAKSRSTCQSGRRPQPRPATINACLVSWPLTRQVCGDSTAKSRPSLKLDGSDCTICKWSANSGAPNVASPAACRANGWPAPTTATICTDDKACTVMRGWRKCSPAMMPSVWLPDSKASIGPPSGKTATRVATMGYKSRMALSAAPTVPMGNRVSTTSDSSSSTPVPMPCARARRASTRSRMSRALASSAWPCGVITGRWPARSNNVTPNCCSILAMAWLTADCTRERRRAAARKLPASATAANTRNWSRVRASIIGGRTGYLFDRIV
ncbi:hypothetical protein D3C85_1155760 [compost metagenome]